MSVEITRHLLVDGIGITVVIATKELHGFAYDQLFGIAELQSTLVPNGKIIVIKDEYCTRLEYYPEYHSKKNNRRIAEITIGANILFGVGSLHRYFTLKLYPSNFQGSDFEHFKTVLDNLLPDFNYTKLYHNSKVNYLELASDCLSHANHSFLPYRKYCKVSNVYQEDDGYLGTTYLGSTTSNLMFHIYDKKKQLHDKGKASFTKLFPHTRIEAAMRRLKVSPSELIHMKNPFNKIAIADLDKAQAITKDDGWAAFIDECKIVGVPTALYCHPAKRKKYLGKLDSIQVSWWKPDVIWQKLPKALARIAP